MIVAQQPRPGHSNSTKYLSATPSVYSPRRPSAPRLSTMPGGPPLRTPAKQLHLPIGAVPVRPPPAAAVLPPIAATLPHVRTDCSSRLPRCDIGAPAPAFASLAPRPSLRPTFTVPLVRVEAVSSAPTEPGLEQPSTKPVEAAPPAEQPTAPTIDDSPVSASSYDERTITLHTATREVLTTEQPRLTRQASSRVAVRKSPRVVVPPRGQFVVCNMTSPPGSPETPDEPVVLPTPALPGSSRPVVRAFHVPSRKPRPPSHTTKRAIRRVSVLSAASSTMPAFVNSSAELDEEPTLGKNRALYPRARQQRLARNAHAHKRSLSHPEHLQAVRSALEQYRISAYHSEGDVRSRMQPEGRYLEVFRSDEEIEIFEDASSPPAPERAEKLQRLRPQFSLRNLKLFGRRTGVDS